MRSLEELKKIDDGGSFDRLMKRMEREANGDESLKLTLMTESIMKAFVNMHSRKAMEPKSCLAVVDQKGKEEEQINGNIKNFDLNFKIPPRSEVPPPSDLPKFESQEKVSLKRCFFEQEQQQEKEEKIVKKPAAKKQRKSDSLEKKIKKKTSETEHYPIPDLPQQFKDQIERLKGTNVMLVSQKELRATDLCPSQGRFAVPRLGAITHDFLTEEELIRLDTEGPNESMQCSLIEPCLQVTTDLEFKKWKMGKTFLYVLKKRWNSVARNRRNQLRPYGMVQLWSFRVGSDLWFALVNLQLPQE